MGRRHITTAVTMLALCALLVVGALWGWQSLFAPVPSDQATVQQRDGSCAKQRLRVGERLRSAQVRVSVFNGGTESGLADTTLAALRTRGFKTGDIGNAPTDADVTRVQVWSMRKNDVAARLVARQFGKKIRVTRADEDLGPGVDVVVGNDFRRLAPATRVIRVRTAQKVCVSGTGT